MSKIKSLILLSTFLFIIVIFGIATKTQAAIFHEEFEGEVKETDIIDINFETGAITKQDFDPIETFANIDENIHRIEPYIPEGVEEDSIMPYGTLEPASKVNNAICYIDTSFSDKDIKRATGFLVGPNLLLTCGHCVFDNVIKNKETPYISVYAGRNGNASKGVSSVKYARVQGGWYNNYDEKYDWCLLVLNSNLGNEVGTLGFAYSDDYSYFETKKEIVKLVGYPAQKDEIIRQYQGEGPVYTATPLTLKFKINKMREGASGSPIFDSKGYAIGIASKFWGAIDRENFTRGQCVNINKTIFQFILSLR